MKDITCLNNIEVGMILQDKRKSRRFVVIELNLNGDDEYYSRVKVIPEDTYIKNKGKTISEKELDVVYWIEQYEFRDYIVCDDVLEIHTERMYSFK